MTDADASLSPLNQRKSPTPLQCGRLAFPAQSAKIPHPAAILKVAPELSLLTFGNEENRYAADTDGLLRFLQEEAMPSYEARRKELQNMPLIRG